jgi:tRNA(adenine34) deaminase
MTATVARPPVQQTYEAAMRLAIAEARKALASGELPYGAVIVTRDGQFVAGCHDTVAIDRDPTRHGELEVVRRAIAVRGGDLSGCLLVSTAEPCCMCSGAAWYAGIATVVYGIGMAELKKIRPDALEEPLGPVAEIYRGMSRKLRAVPGVLHEECRALWTRPVGR